MAFIHNLNLKITIIVKKKIRDVYESILLRTELLPEDTNCKDIITHYIMRCLGDSSQEHPTEPRPSTILGKLFIWSIPRSLHVCNFRVGILKPLHNTYMFASIKPSIPLQCQSKVVVPFVSFLLLFKSLYRLSHSSSSLYNSIILLNLFSSRTSL